MYTDDKSLHCFTGGVPGSTTSILPGNSRVSHDFLCCDAGVHEKLRTEMDSGSSAPSPQCLLYLSGDASGLKRRRKNRSKATKTAAKTRDRRGGTKTSEKIRLRVLRGVLGAHEAGPEGRI